jgi:acetolactate decarboxylase
VTKEKIQSALITLSLCILIYSISTAQQATHGVNIVGKMKNVLWEGQLFGNIHLDTIFDKSSLYGLGPVENLSGEILIIDGRSYLSTVTNDTTIRMEETFDIRAPFFGYAHIHKWFEQTLPDSVQTISQLEQFLNNITKSSPRPFMFKLTVEEATIHIINLPKGSIVNSPEDVHSKRIGFRLKNEPSEIVGFFSTDHKTIFTHHDTYLHMHLISADRQKMGHLDEAVFKKGSMKLFLPAE